MIPSFASVMRSLVELKKGAKRAVLPHDSPHYYSRYPVSSKLARPTSIPHFLTFFEQCFLCFLHFVKKKPSDFYMIFLLPVGFIDSTWTHESVPPQNMPT